MSQQTSQTKTWRFWAGLSLVLMLFAEGTVLAAEVGIVKRRRYCKELLVDLSKDEDARLLLQHVYDDLDDDQRRDVLAERLWELADPLNDLIRAQLELDEYTRTGATPVRPVGELRELETTLLEKHETSWVNRALADNVYSVTFDRGLPKGISISAADLIEHGERIFKENPSITDIRLEYFDLPSLEILLNQGFMSRVRSLSLGTRPDLDGYALASLLSNNPSLSQLRKLDLGSQNIRNGGLELLANSQYLKKLTSMKLNNNSITSAGVRILADSENFAALEELDLGRNPIGDEGLKIIAGSKTFKNLNALSLESVHANDKGVKALAKSKVLRNLKALALGSNPFGEVGMKAIVRSSKLSGLRELSLDNCFDAWAGIAAFKKTKLLNLRKLSLKLTIATAVPPIAAFSKGSFPNLEELDLSGNQFGDEGIRSLAAAHMPKLRKLGLQGVRRSAFMEAFPLSESAIQALAQSDIAINLEELDLSSNYLSNSDISSLVSSEQLAGLKSLNLGWNKLTKKGFLAVLNSQTLESLTDLNVSGNKIGPFSAKKIKDTSVVNLHSLQAFESNLSDKGVAALASWRGLRDVDNLNLGYNRIGDEGAEALGSSPNFKNLRNLNIHGNEISFAGWRSLLRSPDIRRVRDNRRLVFGPIWR